MLTRTRLALLLLIAFQFAAEAAAQTTGTIEGIVRDRGGLPLPGVTVEATSAALPGVTMSVSGQSGRFRLLFLPPGSYRVRCSLAGFATVEQEGIVVSLGHTVTLDVQMQPAFEEELTVTAAPAAVDVRSAEVGANVTPGFFLALPVDRNYTSVVQVAPGTSKDASGTVVYGSTGLENAYYIDGVNTTDVYWGSEGKSLNFEFIGEVQVKTGGYAAEFGRATGGVVNVITKSGGNEFHGDAFGYYYSDALQSPPKPEVESYGRENAGSFLIDAFREADVGVDLGGYLLKDRLWFFAAYDRVEHRQDQRVTKDFSPWGGPPEGKVYVASELRHLWAAKLTWRASAGHSLVASAFGDPARDEGPFPEMGLNGEESTFLGIYDKGGSDAMLHYQGVLGDHALVEAQASHYSTQFSWSGPGSSLAKVVDTTTALFAQTGVPSNRGGLGGSYEEWAIRDSARLNATLLVDDLAGAHEIKLGVDGERVRDETKTIQTAGNATLRCALGHLTSEGCPPEWTYYRHNLRLSEAPAGGVFDPAFADYVVYEFPNQPSNDNQAAFFQDTWRVSPNLTLNLGVRWERQRMHGRDGTLALELTDEWAPRAGFVWDFRGDAAGKLFGSWGRYYETVPTTLSLLSFNGAASAGVSNLDPSSVLCDPALDAEPAYVPCFAFGGATAPVDPAGVEGQYVDETVLGAEYTAARDFILGARLIYRKLDRVVEDSIAADGYYIGNPGYGRLASALDLSYSWLLPVARPQRIFQGVELTASKRLSNDWQLLASYLWSKLEGNYDGNYYPDYNQWMPNLSAAFDYAEFGIHNDGYLSNDRRHQAKVSATYRFPFGLTAGASAYYRSGSPVSGIGYAWNYGNILYLSERGDWGRTDPEYEADLHLGYPLRVGGVEVNLLLDVFHLLDRQGETGRDQRYNYIDPTLDVLDYATGTPLPPIPRGTPCTSLVAPALAYSCNPGFDSANAWQEPRSVRLGVRITF